MYLEAVPRRLGTSQIGKVEHVNEIMKVRKACTGRCLIHSGIFPAHLKGDLAQMAADLELFQLV